MSDVISELFPDEDTPRKPRKVQFPPEYAARAPYVQEVAQLRAEIDAIIRFYIRPIFEGCWAVRLPHVGGYAGGVLDMERNIYYFDKYSDAVAAFRSAVGLNK